MKAEWHRRWVDRLESGEDEQINGALRSDSGYCCLGILADELAKDGLITCEIHQDAYDDDDFARDLYRYDGNLAVLTDYILDIVGLPTWESSQSGADAGSVHIDRSKLPADVTKRLMSDFDDDSNLPVSLAALNDRNIPFPDIARIIREQIPADDSDESA